MVKDILSRKGLVIAVILLFIGLAVAPSINADVGKDSEMVKYTTELCGFGGAIRTIELTQKQSLEVEELFDSIKERLESSETKEESEEIFKEIIVSLDKYGLLGGLSIKQAQRLVTGNNMNSIFFKESEKSNNYDNALCSIYGDVSNAFHFNYWLGLLSIFFSVMMNYNWISGYMRQRFILPYLPFKLATFISIGWRSCAHEAHPRPHPSVGYIWTDGLNGETSWDGKLEGKSFRFTGEDLGITYNEYLVGVEFFKGLSYKSNGKTRFFGSAKKVNIEYRL